MFDLEAVVELLRQEGSDTHEIEAKTAAGGVPSSLAETLSAFANTPGGGWIVLGLDERRGFAPVDIDVPKLKKAVASVARQAVRPPATIELIDSALDGHHLLVVRVDELTRSAKPCIVKQTGKAYLRCWDGDFELSEVELQGLLVDRTQPRFDSQPAIGTSLQDLDEGLIADYVTTARATDRGLARISDDHDLLVKTGVVDADGVPTVAGVLALGVYPQQWFPNYVIQAAASPEPGSPPGTRVGDVARFSGPLPQMIDDALTWVAGHSRHRIIDTPDGRVRDQYDFPPIAVRELLSNALVHRDLSEWSWSRAIELRITNTQLRLVNPGGLYGITVARLFENQLTSARNLALTRICQYVTLRDGRVVEAHGTGLPKILAATVDDGLPPPQFFDQAISFTAILTRPSGDSHEARDRDRLVSSESPTPAEQRVLDALGDRPRTQAELATQLELTDQAVLKHLRRLRSMGRVTMAGGPGHRGTTYSRTASSR